MATAKERPSTSQRKRRHVGEKRRQPSCTNAKISPAAISGVHDDDEDIHLLRTFLEITKDFPSPQTAAATLFERVGKSLSVEITHSQLIDKLKKLRNNYAKQALNKDSIKTLNPRDRAIFDISNEIWGVRADGAARGMSNGSENAGESSKKKKKKNKKKKKAEEENEVVEVETPEEGEDVRVGRDGVDVMGLEMKYAFLMEEVSRLPGNNETIMREGLKLMNGSEMEKLNRKWRLQQIKEAKFLAERDGFVEKVKRLILEATEGGSRDSDC